MAIQIASNQIKTGAVSATQIEDSSITPGKINLTQSFDFSGGTLRAGNPSNNADVAIKSYVDGLVGSGVFWKEPAKVASTANVNIANPGTDSFDGVTISSGARIVLKNQSSNSENGVYIFNGSGSAMTRASDCNTAAELNGAALFVTDGTASADAAYVQTATVSNLGSDAVTWVQFSGLGQVVAGDALGKVGNRLDVLADDSSIEVAGDALQIKDLGVTNAKLAGSITASKLAGSIGDDKLNQITSAAKVAGSAVQLNGSGGLENSSGLKISDLGVSAAMLAGNIGDAKLSTIVSGNKVSGSAVQLNGAGGLEDSSGLKISNLGVSDGMLAGGISASKLAGSIPDSKLSTITSGNKVSGSAVQLAGSGGLEDASGLKISSGGVSDVMLAGNIPDSKMLQIVSAAKVAGSAVQLKGGGGLANDAGLKVDTNGIVTAMIGSNQITSAKINFAPTRETLTTNGNTTAFTLSNSVPADFDDVLVFRNGLLVERVGSNPSGVDQYTSALVGNACTVTFGTAPAGSDKVIVHYMNLK